MLKILLNCKYNSKFINSVFLVLLVPSNIYVRCKDTEEYNTQRDEESISIFEKSDSTLLNYCYADTECTREFSDQESFDDSQFSSPYLGIEKVKTLLTRKIIPKKNPPPKPLSDFFWFTLDERSKVRSDHPDYYETDVARELGRRWDAAEPHIRKKYEAIADEDKARYEKEMLEYEKLTGNKGNAELEGT